MEYSNAKEVLGKAEQGLLKNIRKILNYMEVCDPENSVDRSRVAQKAEEYFLENREILNHSSDFLMAMTEYLNSQGAKENLQAMEDYKIKSEVTGAIKAYRLDGTPDEDIIAKVTKLFDVTKEYVLALLTPQKT